MLLLLCVVSLNCRSSGASGCDNSALIANLKSLISLDWRDVSQDLAVKWRANTVDAYSSNIRTHVGERQNDACLCCESLIFTQDESGRHLEAVGVSHTSGTKSEAIALANDLVRAIFPAGERFQPLEIIDGPVVSKSFASPRFRDSTRVLDARVSRMGDEWLVNVYWSRVYGSNSH